MMITVGLVVLLVAGAWQLTATHLSGMEGHYSRLAAGKTRFFSATDRRRPWRVLADRGKRRNAAMIGLELVALVAAGATVAVVVTHPGVPMLFETVTVASLVVGALLVLRGVYVRLGLYRPAMESLADYRATVAGTIGQGAAEEFEAVYGALSTSRGPGADGVTAALLAAARTRRTVDDVVAWCETTDVCDAEMVESRARTLDEAGVVDCEDGRLRVAERVGEVETDRLAAVAVSVLN